MIATRAAAARRHLLDRVDDHALGLVEERQPRRYDSLLEEPDVLRARVVVDAVDEGEPQQRAPPAEEAVNQAGGANGTAVCEMFSRRRHLVEPRVFDEFTTERDPDDLLNLRVRVT